MHEEVVSVWSACAICEQVFVSWEEQLFNDDHEECGAKIDRPFSFIQKLCVPTVVVSHAKTLKAFRGSTAFLTHQYFYASMFHVQVSVMTCHIFHFGLTIRMWNLVNSYSTWIGMREKPLEDMHEWMATEVLSSKLRRPVALKLRMAERGRCCAKLDSYVEESTSTCYLLK